MPLIFENLSGVVGQLIALQTPTGSLPTRIVELAAGPTGPTGATGATGPTGPTGPTGASGYDSANPTEWDEFTYVQSVDATSASANVATGDGNWWVECNAANTGTIAAQTAEADHPGILRATPVSTGSSRVTLSKGAPAFAAQCILGNQLLSIGFVARVPSVTDMAFRLGVADGVVTAALTGMYFQYDSSIDGNLHAITRIAGTATDTSLGAFSSLVFNSYEVRQTAVGTIEFLFDGAVVATHTTNVPSTQGVSPSATVISRSLGGRPLDLDRYQLALQPVSR